MNRDRILLVALLVVCVLQSLVTMTLVASQRRAEEELGQARQQLTDLATKTDRLQTILAGLPQEVARLAPAPTTTANGEQGDAPRGRHGKDHGDEQAKAAGRTEAIVTVLAQLMVLEYRGDVMLSPEQIEHVKVVFQDYKKGTRDGVRKRLLGQLNGTQIQFLNDQAKLVDEKALQLRNIPNASEATYVDLALDFLERPLRPDEAGSGQPK